MPAVLDRVPPYLPTHRFRGEFLNESHAFYAACPEREHLIDVGIEGWLRRQDALKLYELAFLAKGDLLELGSYKGLSTSILSRANHDSGLGKRVVSVEMNAGYVDDAKRALGERGLGKNVEFLCGEAVAACEALAREGRRFDFVFVDHDHGYRSVLDVARQLASLTNPGGFCLFHDYLDARNNDPGNDDYGVFQGARDGLDARKMEFFGVFGVTGLYRARRPGLLARVLGRG